MCANGLLLLLLLLSILSLGTHIEIGAKQNQDDKYIATAECVEYLSLRSFSQLVCTRRFNRASHPLPSLGVTELAESGCYWWVSYCPSW